MDFGRSLVRLVVVGMADDQSVQSHFAQPSADHASPTVCAVAIAMAHWGPRRNSEVVRDSRARYLVHPCMPDQRPWMAQTPHLHKLGEHLGEAHYKLQKFLGEEVEAR